MVAPLAQPVPFTVDAALDAPRRLREGCYALRLQPADDSSRYEGTLRVDRSAPDPGSDTVILSGDLYVASAVPGQGRADAASVAARASRPGGGELLRRIPIFPRARYHSYLKVIAVEMSGPGKLRLVVEQYDYTHPSAGSFLGSFPATASRTATITMTNQPGNRFTGRWSEGGVDKGTFSMSWVSRFFRRATLEIDTLLGSVAPRPVPDGTGGTEYFDTIYAKHGWQLDVVTDQAEVPVPSGVDPVDCWSAGSLHNLMASVRDPGTDLDQDWRLHLVVVPARLGCSRGVMYDQIDVPREGCASFSDDGYPDSDSPNFGAAENGLQRDFPRAYLRSATHEVTHTFNQIHQEAETAADNSIMSTTPSVADVLGGPATGAPGVFPDQIDLEVNATVRHHLDHMPDPVIRPGGWPFGAWFGTGTPEAADRNVFCRDELELSVTLEVPSVVVGEPLPLSWTLTNRTEGDLMAPNDISLEALFTSITVTDADGNARPFRPFVIRCDSARLAALPPGRSVTATHRVFWSSAGFAFPRPGTYHVSVEVAWSAGRIPVGVREDVEVFVEFPTSAADNEAAGLVLTDEVGKWVALGGDAYHLTRATSRLSRLADRRDRSAVAGEEAGAQRAPRLLAGFEGLLPDPSRL